MRSSILGLFAIAGCGAVSLGPDAMPDAVVPDAAPAAPISDVLECGAPASAGGLADGTDLQRVDIDVAAFPAARCNDGTPATFFFRPASTPSGRNRWVIQLQGGGGCRTPDDCAKRWCSIDTNFGMTQMSSTLAPAVGIVGDGILYRGSMFPNPLGDVNQVFLRYCSSDTYSGQSGPIDLDAKHPITGAPVRFRIEFEGQAIFDAMIASLRRDGAAPPAYTLGGGSLVLPDLDDATDVLLAGASAGGGGTINHADRLGELLRMKNSACQGASCPLIYAALVDSTFGPSNELLDWSTSTMCATTGACTWKDVLAAGTSMFEHHGDSSCATWHAANAPDTAYLCGDTDHVLRNHVTTPFMVRQGLRDQLISGNAIESAASVPGRGPMTLALFAELVHDQLGALAMLTTSAEEHAAIPRTPAVFGPPCPDHETLSTNRSVYSVKVNDAGVPYTMFGVAGNWFTGALPQQVIYAPGDPVVCP